LLLSFAEHAVCKHPLHVNPAPCYAMRSTPAGPGPQVGQANRSTWPPRMPRWLTMLSWISRPSGSSTVTLLIASNSCRPPTIQGTARRHHASIGVISGYNTGVFVTLVCTQHSALDDLASIFHAVDRLRAFHACKAWILFDDPQYLTCALARWAHEKGVRSPEDSRLLHQLDLELPAVCKKERDTVCRGKFSLAAQGTPDILDLDIRKVFEELALAVL